MVPDKFDAVRTFIPNELERKNRYKLLIGAITPRPIALVSTCDSAGTTNLAPYSFFNGVGSEPMSLLFCPSSLENADKDTLRNCLPVEEGGTGEFVVNVAVEEYARAMAATAESLPFGVSEFDACGFTPAPSRIVRPPRVLQSPIAFECRTTHVIRLTPGEPRGHNIVVGEVVCIWADNDVVNERFHVDPEKLRTVGRMGGKAYCRTRERFELEPNLTSLALKPPFEEDVGPGAPSGNEQAPRTPRA